MFNKLYEMGYSVIPVARGGKNPIIPGWTKYCTEMPTQEQVDTWESGDFNIGIACGPASGIVVVDIDTDDKNIMSIVPPSPVVRRGMKGEARFFKFHPSIKSQRFPLLDLLSIGRQILVPPSIHPTTKTPYIWLTEDTLENMRASELPDLDMSFLDKLLPLLKVFKMKSTVGRNNKLVDIVTSMRGRGEGQQDIIREIYEWDRDNHVPRLFLDEKEGFKGSTEDDAIKNASIFENRITSSLVKNGVVRIEIGGSIREIDPDKIDVSEEFYKELQFPEPTGILRDIQQLIIDESIRYMPNIALGGAIALMSALCSNRFRFGSCWTNTYVLNLAPTGAGKSFPQTVIKRLLIEIGSSNLIGCGDYASSSAFCSNLISKRERLDIVDEISGLFAHMKSGGLYQQSIVDEMCKVWSASSGLYMGTSYSSSNDNQSISSCYNPCVNVFGSSTVGGVKENISKMMTTKGLMPRFLIFLQEDYGELKQQHRNLDLFSHVCGDIKKLLRQAKRPHPTIKDELMGPCYDPVDLSPEEPGAVEFARDFFFKTNRRIEEETSESLKSMLTRSLEQVMKLATIHAAGNFRIIEVADLAWAMDTYEACFKNSASLITETSVSNEWEKSLKSVETLFKKSNGGAVTLAKIKNARSHIDPGTVKKILDYLEKTDTVVRRPNKIGSGFGWVWVGSRE